MNFWYLFKFIKRYIFYTFSDTRRYSELLSRAIISKPIKILEIGVFRGKRAIELIECAKIFNKKIMYYGFDLFEDITNLKIKNELSKRPLNKEEIILKLLKVIPNIYLFKGNTNKTLKLLNNNKKFDFIFIDGGHSIKTIANDWKYAEQKLKKNGIIVLDDYYVGCKEIIKKFGCNSLVSQLDDMNLYNIEFSKRTDFFKKNYGIKLVFIKKNIAS
jgi:predicted O-methyltransferase YrrM